MKIQSKDYKHPTIKPVWCPGCGDYAVLNAVQKALSALEVKPEELGVVSGIGCSGRFSHYFNSYSLHGTHGRALPIATGLKAARPDLTVLAAGGDGDGLAIGGGHIAHAARKNVDITYILMDNTIYALTKGQSSPTSSPGARTKTAPYGVYEDSLNPLAMFLAYDVSFIARTTSLKIKEMEDILIKAISHPGFSIVHVMSPCVTHKSLTYDDIKSNVPELPQDYDPADKLNAYRYVYEEKMYTGIFYKTRKTTLEERLAEIGRRVTGLSYNKHHTMTTSQIMEEYR